MGRAFGFLSLVLGLGIGMYLYSRQMQNTPGVASNPQVTINLTGVKTDLMSIAQAERRYFASENKYASFDELISTNFITVARQRPPYTYAVEITSGGFRVIATRSGAETSGTPAQISVDENMEFQTSE